MSFTREGNRGTNNDKTAGTSVGVNPTSAIAAGQLVFATFAGDNIGTTQGDTTSVTVSDSQSNTYTRLFEHTRTDGGSGDGATVAVFFSVLDTGLGTGDTVTATHPNIAARSIGLEEFSFTGSGVNKVDENATNGTTSSTSVTLSGLTSSAYLWIGGVASERYGDGSYTQDSDYSDLGIHGTLGGGPAGNVQFVGGYRSYTGTSDTYGTIISVTDWASGLGALEETGGVTVTPAAINAIASKADPTVVKGSITVSPSAREAIAGKLDPTVGTGGVIVTPSPAPALTERINPTIAPITETKVSPNPGSAIASKADPTVVAGDIYITPAAAAGARAVRATPTVHFGSTTASPSPSTTIAGRANPGIFQSSTTATPTPASAIARKQDPPLNVTPPQSGAIASSTGPTVTIGGIIPTPASAIASGANPTVDLGGITITPDTPVDCITRFAAPTVWIRNPVIVSMTLPARSFAWSLSDRAGIYVETQLEFEDGSLALFEDGDSLIWGASNAGIRLPVRPFALTIESRD